MTRIPKGADLILNKVSGAPGFWIGNVIVMAGVPSIMQAMLDEVAPKLKTGVRMLSETVRADVREGDIGMQLGEIALMTFVPACMLGAAVMFFGAKTIWPFVQLLGAFCLMTRLVNWRSARHGGPGGRSF